MTPTATARSVEGGDTTPTAPHTAAQLTLNPYEAIVPTRTPPHRCAGCGARWSGTRTAHCGGGTGCHRTFTVPSAFDRHHRGGTCHPPPDVGLVASGRRTTLNTTVWGYPGGGEVPGWRSGHDQPGHA